MYGGTCEWIQGEERSGGEVGREGGGGDKERDENGGEAAGHWRRRRWVQEAGGDLYGGKSVEQEPELVERCSMC